MVGILYLEILSPEMEWKILRTISYGNSTQDSEDKIKEELQKQRYQWNNTVYRNGNFRIVREASTGRGIEVSIIS